MAPEKRSGYSASDESSSGHSKRPRLFRQRSSMGQRIHDEAMETPNYFDSEAYAMLEGIKINARNKPKPSDVLKTGELLVRIANAVYGDRPDDYHAWPRNQSEARDLSNFRLVNKAFAAAGAVPCFREFEIVGGDLIYSHRRKDGNSVKHLLGLLREYAPLVRSLKFSGFQVERDCAILVPEGLKKESSFSNPRQLPLYALSVSLGYFTGLRTLQIQLPSDAANPYLDLWLNLVGRVNPSRLTDLIIDLSFAQETPLPFELEWYDQAHAPQLIDQLRAVSINHLCNPLSDRTDSWKMEFLAGETLKLIHRLTTPIAASNFEHMQLSHWYNVPRQITLPPEPRLPVAQVRNLKTLQLLEIKMSGRDLRDLLIRCRGTLLKLELGFIELTDGYWHEILKELDDEHPKLHKVFRGGLGYWPDSPKIRPQFSFGAMFQRSSHTPSNRQHNDDASEFAASTFVTLNPKDRAAIIQCLSSLHAGREEISIELVKARFKCSHARCAGMNRDETSRCKRLTDVYWDEAKRFWVHREDKSRIDRTWLCYVHGNQTARLLTWPWELPG